MKYLDLKQELINHNYLYHIQDNPVISDEEYDKKLIELKRMEKQQGFADVDSPSQTIGSAVVQGRKVKHNEKMYSLENAFSVNEVNAFFSKYPEEDYCCEPKVDGMSGSIIYKDRKLSMGVSRGDGFIGENITENVLCISNIPKEISDDGLIEIRGEFVIFRKYFEEINQERLNNGLKPYTTLRNAVSGLMRSLDSRSVIERYVKFYAYGTINWKDENYLIRRRKISDFGFEYVPTLVIDSLEKVEIISQTIYSAKDEYEYDIDGVVIKLNSAILISSLGYTSKDPKWAIARKWNSEGVIAELLDIENQVGRTGVITPVAKISPVEIGGVVVTSATLHNYDEIKRLGLIRGCKIRLVRSGEVIPKVEGIYFDGNTNAVITELFQDPTECPHCKSPVTSIGVRYYCTNKYCSGQLKAKLIYFASRPAMNIIDLSEATIAQLLLKGFVRSYADFYKLTKRNLMALDGFADKSAENLLRNIENSRTPSLDKFIVAIGIPNVAQGGSKALAKRFHSIDNLKKATMLDLIEIDDVGPKTAQEIFQYFNSAEDMKLLNDVLEYVKPVYNVETSTDELLGKSFVLTGSFHSDRKEIGNVLEKYGAKVTGSVSSKTTLLIVGENPGANKTKDAKKHNVKQVDYSGKNLSEIIDSIFEYLKIPKPHQPF